MFFFYRTFFCLERPLQLLPIRIINSKYGWVKLYCRACCISSRSELLWTDESDCTFPLALTLRILGGLPARQFDAYCLIFPETFQPIPSSIRGIFKYVTQKEICMQGTECKSLDSWSKHRFSMATHFQIVAWKDFSDFSCLWPIQDYIITKQDLYCECMHVWSGLTD